MTLAQLTEGTVLSTRYQIVRRIGAGALGTVFEARDLEGDEHVALKLLAAEHAKSERVRRTFQVAARTAARMSHPNIVRCFGPGESNDPLPHIVYELLDGAPLTSYLEPGLTYDPPYAVPMMQAVLLALTEAHRRGLVHGNLKPANVFLVRNPGGPPIVKVLDFGMMQVMDAALDVAGRTRDGELLLAPRYLSPEQIRNSASIDARTDLWSVGVLLYELLTGREAFPAADDEAKRAAILSADHLPIDYGKPELAAWRRFFASVLVRDLELRFSSASAMEQALSATAEEAAHARPRSLMAASTTDMSPELPPGVSGSAARHAYVITPAPRRPEVVPDGAHPISQPLPSIPMRPGIPVWAAILIGALCALVGFALGWMKASDR
jgi:serine/threonine-protein kinase